MSGPLSRSLGAATTSRARPFLLGVIAILALIPLLNLVVPPYKFVSDTLVSNMAFTGFTTVQTAPAVVTVGNGRLYHNGLCSITTARAGHRSIFSACSRW